MSDYEPGRLYTAKWDGEPVTLLRSGIYGYPWIVVNGADILGIGSSIIGDVITDVRGPLIVLDPPRAFRDEPFTGNLRDVLTRCGYAWLVRQVDEQTRPPKPTEPMGLGAVVKDRHDRLWVRTSLTTHPWAPHLQGSQWARWEDLDVPDEDHILGRGVDPNSPGREHV